MKPPHDDSAPGDKVQPIRTKTKTPTEPPPHFIPPTGKPRFVLRATKRQTSKIIDITTRRKPEPEPEK